MMLDFRLFVSLLGFIFHSTNATHAKIGLLIDENIVPADFPLIYNSKNQNSTNVVVKEIPNVSHTQSTVCDMILDGAVGIISYASCYGSFMIHWCSKQFPIPFIMIVNQSCQFPKEVLPHIHLQPICTEKNAAIASIISQLIVANVTIFHDEMSAFCMHDLIQRLSENSIRSKTITCHSYQTIRNHIDVLKSSEPCYIILITSKQRVTQYLQRAKEDGLLGSTFFWIISSNELSELDIDMEITVIQNSNVLLIQPFISEVSDQEHVCSKSNTSFATTLLESTITLMQTAIIKSEETGLDLTNRSACTDTLPKNNDQILNTMLQKILLEDQSHIYDWFSSQRDVNRIYHLCSAYDLNKESLQRVGTWDKKHGLRKDRSQLFPNTRIDFKNKTLTVVTRMAMPFDVKIEEENASFSYSGFCFDILDELARSFNFRYKVIEPPDGLYGAPTENGSWNGMVGMVIRGEADMSIAPFTITSLREAVIDFSVPIMEDGVGIIMKKPTSDTENMFHMFLPFSPAVWGCLSAAIVIVGCVLFIINKKSPYSAHNIESESEFATQETFLGCLWMIYAAFVEEGGPPFPRAVSSRCVLGVWWVFTIVLLSSYTANLAAVLTVTITKRPINSLLDLADNTQIKPLVKAGTSLHSLFKNSKSVEYQNVWKRMSDMPVVKTAEKSLELVKTGKYAFMTDVSQLEYAMLKECDAYEIADEVFNQAGLGFVFPENAPFIKAFNYKIMRMHESGMIERWRRQWWPQSSQCSLSDRLGSAHALGLNSLAGLFFVYASVVGISIFGLFIEAWWKRRKIKRENNDSDER